MRRSTVPVLPGLAIVLLLGCRLQVETVDAPETNEAAEIGRLRAEQDDLRERLAETEARLERERAQHEEARGRLHELMARVDALEGARERKPVAPGQIDPEARYRVELGASHVRGPDDALVTIVEWASFQCGFSKRVQPTLRELEARYSGKVRIVYKHNPLPMFERATPAALAAEAAGRQGKFWEMHDRLWEHQKELTDATFLRLAKQLRLDVARFKRDLKNPALRGHVRHDEDQASRLGARGTPAFFINGRHLSGARPIDQFTALIDEELAHAQRLVADGTPPSEVYDRLMRGARTAP